MGQAAAGWCGVSHIYSNDVFGALASFPQPSKDKSRAALQNESEADALLSDCPRELTEILRHTKQWAALRCRPWLSTGAFRGLLRSLHQCQLQKVFDRYKDAGTLEECSVVVPPLIPWADLDADHVVSAGQIFRLKDASHGKIRQLRKLGLSALRQGKVGVVLLAGGANLRLGCDRPPIGCSQSAMKLLSGKSILQLCCERIRRILVLCRSPEDPTELKRQSSGPSIPVFVMTSKLTHRTVIGEFEANHFFGLPSRDVFFFEQTMHPILGDHGRLLPQSLGGEFAHAPGGTGDALCALVKSLALEQMRDRGIECLHIVGIENVLARVCDPLFIGFCQELDVDCACKVVARNDPYEDLDLFCIRQSPVATQLADTEEAACRFASPEAPSEVLEERTGSALNYLGVMNSCFFSVAYVAEVVGRPVRPRKLSRVVPYLDFHTAPIAEQSMAADPPSLNLQHERDLLKEQEKITLPNPNGIQIGSWPAETPSPDFACQQALLSASAEVRTVCRAASVDLEGAWRCEVLLDDSGPNAILRISNTVRGPLYAPDSIAPQDTFHGLPNNVSNYHKVVRAAMLQLPLKCSLVVPSQPNAFVLDVSLLDYFEYTDRAVAFEVERHKEFAAVCETKGPRSPESARYALQALHISWLASVNGNLPQAINANSCVEISPLLSYEGEGLENAAHDIQPPCVLRSCDEDIEASVIEDPSAVDSSIVESSIAEDLDTRLFYMQEYPQRPQMSHSHKPQFRGHRRVESLQIPLEKPVASV